MAFGEGVFGAGAFGVGAAPSALLTVPAGTVTESLTAFPIRVDLSHMPADWWAGTSTDLGNVRVRRKSDGVDLPVDIVTYNRLTKTGSMYFKADLTTGTNEFLVVATLTGTALAATDPIGRNAVWSDYQCMFDFYSASDRTGKTSGYTLAGSALTAATEPGFLYNNALSSLAVSGVGLLTQYTMGITFITRGAAVQSGLLSYGDTGATTGSRETIGLDNGNRLGAWNSTNSWTYYSGAVDTVTGTKYRVAEVFNGTSGRTLYRDGVAGGSRTTTAQRPPTGNVLYIGASTTSSERARAEFSRAYLRSGVLSAGWLAAENKSWEAPSTFYATQMYGSPATITLAQAATTALARSLFVNKDGAVLASQTLTIPAGKVASNLTGFVSRLDLSHLSTAFWAQVNTDGSNIRVKQAGVDVPTDLVWINKAAKTGELFFKASLNSSSTNTFSVQAVATDIRPNDAADQGRNAVWSDYDVVLAGDSATNRTGSGLNATVVGSNVAAATYRSIQVSGPLSAHQGVARNPANGDFLVIDTDDIWRFDSNWNLLVTESTPIADSGITTSPSYPSSGVVQHQGDGTVYNGELYIVLERYSNSPYNNQWVTVYDVETLAFKRSYDISANLHEVSSIAYNPTDGYFYITEFPSTGDSRVHRYTTSFAYAGALTLATPLANQQGIAFQGGYMYLAGSGGIWRYNLDGTGKTLAIAPQATLGSTPEGIEPDGTDGFYWLHDSPSSVAWLRPAASVVAPAGFFDLDGRYLKVNGLTDRAAGGFTMGATVVDRLNVNPHAITSYSAEVASDASTGRLTLALNDGKYATWSDANSWNYDTVTVKGYTRGRVIATKSSGTSRKLYRNGAVRNTGTFTDNLQVRTAFYVGTPDETADEKWTGYLNHIYLRPGELSADWLAAEYASWESPATFYSLSADAYAEAVLTDAPRAYWRLGEASGTTALDSSGNGRDGTYLNAPTLGAAGLLTTSTDTSVDFDGVNDRMEVAAASWMDVGTALSVELLIRPDTVSGGHAVINRANYDDSFALGSSSWDWYLQQNSASLTFGIFVGTTHYPVSTGNVLAAGVTAHVVATYDGVNLRIYINGTLAATAAAAAGAINHGASLPLTIAAESGGNQPERFDGRIDEVAFYGSTLSSTRIAAHYAAATGAASPQTVALGQASVTLSAQALTVVQGTSGQTVALSQAGTTAAAQALTPVVGVAPQIGAGALAGDGVLSGSGVAVKVGTGSLGGGGTLSSSQTYAIETAKIVVKAGKVPSTLTDFVVRVNLHHLGDAWWNSFSAMPWFVTSATRNSLDRRSVRVFAADGTELPVDYLRNGSGGGDEIYFKAPTIQTGVDNVFTVVPWPTRKDDDDPLGGHAVWSDYALAVMPDGYDSGRDRTGKTGSAGWSGSDYPWSDNDVATGEPSKEWASLSSYLYHAALPRFATQDWTIGITSVQHYSGASDSEPDILVTYTDDSSNANNAFRASLGRSTPNGKQGLWNSADGWIYGPTIEPPNAPGLGSKQREHISHRQTATARRRLYLNGALQDVQTGAAVRPGDTGPTRLYIGTDDGSNSYNAGFPGSATRWYLREGELSPAWIAAETACWEDPLTFYEVIEPPRSGSGALSGSGRLGAMAYRPTAWTELIASEGPMAWWRMGGSEPGTGIIRDATGHGYDWPTGGTGGPSTTPSLIDGEQDGARRLPTSIHLLDPSDFEELDAYSVEFVFRLDTTRDPASFGGGIHDGTLVGLLHEGGGLTSPWGIGRQSSADNPGGQMYFNAGQGMDLSTGYPNPPVGMGLISEIQVGATYHVVITRNATRWKGFVNGVQVDEITADIAHTSAVKRLSLGGPEDFVMNQWWSNWGNDLAVIDELVYYDYALSEPQIDEHYDLVKTVSGSGDLGGTGTLSGVGTVIYSGVGAPGSLGSLAGDGVTVVGDQYGTGDLSGSGVLTGVGSSVQSGTGAVSGSGSLSGVGYAYRQLGAGTLSGSGVLTGVGIDYGRTGSGGLAGEGVLVGDGGRYYPPVEGDGYLSSAGLLEGHGSNIGLYPAVGPTLGRWVFHDPDGPETWKHPTNPNTMKSPFVPRNLHMGRGTKVGLHRVRGVDAAPSAAHSWTFGGVILTPEHHQELERWANKGVVVQVKDHLERTFEVIIQSYDPEDRQPTPARHWRMKYQMTVLVLKELEPA